MIPEPPSPITYPKIDRRRRPDALLKRQLNDGKWKDLPPADWDVALEADILRDACRRSFWAHFLYGFGAGINPKGHHWIDEVVHKPLADWFEYHVKDWMKKRRLGIREQKHLAVLVHREVGKTTMISEAGQSWLHLLDPEISTYTGSEKTELSQKIVGAIQAVMDGSDPYALWPKLWGNWETASRKWTAKQCTHAARKNTSRADPSLGTFAVETSITGAHPDVIFYDDPISYERMESDTDWLDTVNKQVASLGYVIQADGMMVYVGTRYGDMDHFGVAFRDEGVKSVSGMETDALKPDPNGVWDVFFMMGRDEKHQTPEHPEGFPTTPKVWPESRLRKEKKKNPHRYASQILNDPTLSEWNPLTMEQIMQRVVKPQNLPANMRYAICTDIAFWDGKSLAKDETNYVVHGYPRDGSGDVYIMENHGSSTWRGEDFARHLVATVQRYRRQGRKVFAVTGETTRGGAKGAVRSLITGWFNDANEPINYIEFERGATQKETRLVAACNYWTDGHVWIVENCPGFKELTQQLASIGQYIINNKVKIDRADAHSDAFQPQLYQPMRRAQAPDQPWKRGYNRIPIPGLDDDVWADGDWSDDNPRPPLR